MTQSTPPAGQGRPGEDTGQDAGQDTGQGPAVQGAEPVPPGQDGTPEQMARRLVRDVAAYEVDPPPPGRTTAAPTQE